MQRVRCLRSLVILGCASPGASRAAAQAPFAQLGWNSSMTMVCLDPPDCATIDFAVSLPGFHPFDGLTGSAMPPASPGGDPHGDRDGFSIVIESGPGVFAIAPVASGGGWATFGIRRGELDPRVALPFVRPSLRFRATGPSAGAASSGPASSSAPERIPPQRREGAGTRKPEAAAGKRKGAG